MGSWYWLREWASLTILSVVSSSQQGLMLSVEISASLLMVGWRFGKEEATGGIGVSGEGSHGG